MSKTDVPVRMGIIAQSDLPTWCHPIGPSRIWSQFSMFYGYSDHQGFIEEYVFSCMGGCVKLVAKAWHSEQVISGRNTHLVDPDGAPPLVMIAAGIAAATIHMTVREQRRQDGAP